MNNVVQFVQLAPLTFVIGAVLLVIAGLYVWGSQSSLFNSPAASWVEHEMNTQRRIQFGGVLGILGGALTLWSIFIYVFDLIAPLFA